MSATIIAPVKEDILAAAERIEPFIHRTPVITSKSIDQMIGAEIYFKCENLQKAGAFKARGATNAVMSLPADDMKRGVATHSSGNHAAALSMAARNRGIPAFIVMPGNSSKVKIAAVQSYGGRITFCEPTLAAREETLNQVLAQTFATEIHPYNDLRIIAGQATAALELIEDAGPLDYIFAPVGGGGLLSGTSLSAFYFSPGTKVIAGEPAGADDAYQSFYKGEFVPSVNPETIADGLRTSLGTLTFPIIKKYVTDIHTVSDFNIAEAMKLVWERMKLIIEPSAATPLAALLKNKARYSGKRIGIILSGGNVDLAKLPWQ
ncbi:MAG TPA: pyridoxal-phosphate dependent enzyme [Bacteroidales bacterium]|nr:pyridoxal-phosphate dependent enzyme [Bacteroidales bacterium]